MILYYQQFDNITSWIYFALHGSYGMMWILKSKLFKEYLLVYFHKDGGCLQKLIMIAIHGNFYIHRRFNE